MDLRLTVDKTTEVDIDDFARGARAFVKYGLLLAQYGHFVHDENGELQPASSPDSYLIGAWLETLLRGRSNALDENPLEQYLKKLEAEEGRKWVGRA